NGPGTAGPIRYRRNVMGLWLLRECRGEWADAGQEAGLPALLAAAARLPALRSVIDASDAAFLAPGGMPRRIAAACRLAGQPAPGSPAETVRCVLDSLALAHRHA